MAASDPQHKMRIRWLRELATHLRAANTHGRSHIVVVCWQTRLLWATLPYYCTAICQLRLAIANCWLFLISNSQPRWLLLIVGWLLGCCQAPRTKPWQAAFPDASPAAWGIPRSHGNHHRNHHRSNRWVLNGSLYCNHHRRKHRSFNQWAGWGARVGWPPLQNFHQMNLMF